MEDLYCPDNGRPSVDPVVLFKMVLIQHLYGIRSLRQTVKEIELNIGYRWFLGHTMNQSISHFATVSYAFRHRFSAETVEKVFRWILEKAEKNGYIEPEVVFIDATHIKVNANLHKHVKAAIPRTATVSTTDPESGLFHKGEHKKCFAYGAHTVCDRNNFVLGVEVRPGNIHDGIVFDSVYEELKKNYPQVEVITADAGYKTPWFCKRIIEDGKLPSLPYRRPMTKKGNLLWYEYVYDEYYDCVLCPQNQVLNYATTNRESYREYKSTPIIVRNARNWQDVQKTRSIKRP